jgi:putative thiamine transport system permease protein
MDQALHTLKRIAPALMGLALLIPITAGLLGTLLPALGWWPALGLHSFSLQAWQTLVQAPGTGIAMMQTLWIGWAASVLSLLIALALLAFTYHRPWAKAFSAWLAPVLSMPHSALAVGLAFLLLPSGWLVRWVSPGLTGWDLPPDIATVGHPSGWPLILALCIKEVPYLVLMMLGALNQINARPQLLAARALGYGPTQAWLRVIWPQVYQQIELPLLAVLAFSLSVVDVAMILGPVNPPTLAVLAVRWFADPDSRWILPACAAALGLLALVLASLLLARGFGRLMLAAIHHVNHQGARSTVGAMLAGIGSGAALVVAALTVLTLLSLLLWSIAAQWRWPSVLPGQFSTATWERQMPSVLPSFFTTLWVALGSTGIALVLVVASLEKAKHQAPDSHRFWWLYLPLLIPQVAFLMGLQVLLVRLQAEATLWAVIWAHLVFVLPYLYLSLVDPWRAFDQRFERTAHSLGAGPWRVFWVIKLPLLKKPLLVAFAVGFAVSVGQYLPTLFAGAGRITTLTTEAVTLSSGADRRVMAVWALLQSCLPLLVYALASAWPADHQPAKTAQSPA